MKYVQIFTVEGVGQFPVDMLRYDRCSPRETEDALNLLSSLNDKEPRRVTLVRYTQFKGEEPTTGRWASFGWKVDQQSIRTSKF